MTDFTYLLKFAGFIMLWGLTLIGLYFIQYSYKRYKRAKRFEQAKYNCLYNQIQRMIKEPIPDKKRIKADLDYLLTMKYRNDEMYNVLNIEFLKLYEAELTNEFGE